jgi:hypothetical protein
MAEMTIHLDLRFSRRVLRAGMIGAMLLSAASELSSENVTLTTYYPAPSGVYTQMITTGETYLSRDAGTTGIGTAAPNGAYKLDIEGNALEGPAYDLYWGNPTGAVLSADQGGSLELGGNNGTVGGGTPYIDFHVSGQGVQDFNVRMINSAANTLQVQSNNGNITENVIGRIGLNGYSGAAGYPGGWGGGLHVWDVYAEGTVGGGSGGSLTYTFDNAGNGMVSQNMQMNQSGCSFVNFVAGVTPCGGGQYATNVSGAYAYWIALGNEPPPSEGGGGPAAGSGEMLCCPCPGGACPL